MSIHQAAIDWRRAPHASAPGTYSRRHELTLGGAQAFAVSAGLDYLGDADCADPEQLLLAALASCHMLFFLALAERAGYEVLSYSDRPTAHLEKNAQGRLAVTRIELAPRSAFAAGRQPDLAALQALHEDAHRRCFIAHSIYADVTVTPALA